MNKKKIIIISLSVVAFIVAIYFIFVRKGKDGKTLLGGDGFSDDGFSLTGPLTGGTKSVDPRPCTDAENYNRDWLQDKLPVESDIHAPGETTDCQRNYMNKVCGSEDWKCRKMIKAGAYVPTDYQWNNWNGCNAGERYTLNWVYELYYLSGKSWSEKNDRYKLLKQAEYQRCRQLGKVS